MIGLHLLKCISIKMNYVCSLLTFYPQTSKCQTLMLRCPLDTACFGAFPLNPDNVLLKEITCHSKMYYFEIYIINDSIIHNL